MNVRKLIENLSNEDSSVRRKAAQELGEGDERAIYPLIKALKDPNPGVQDAAIRSLVSIGGEIVAYMILPLLREDPYLRNTAQLMLRELGENAVPLLYSLLSDKDDDIRKFALDLFGDINDGVEAEKLLRLTEDPNPNVRASAIRAIGLLGFTEGSKHMEKALHDEEWVAFTALDSLGLLKAEDSVGAIVMLLNSDSQAIRLAALETLGTIGSPLASDALIKHIMDSKNSDEKSLAVKSLVKVGVTPSMSEVADMLKDMVNESAWEDKLIAIQGLVDLKEFSAIPRIIDITGSLDPSVPDDDEKLMHINRLLEGFGPTDIYADVLKDKGIKFKGKVLAAELAGKTRAKSAVPDLITQLGTDIRDLRKAAAHALGLIGTDEARKALIGLVDDSESNVRKMAITCLGYVPHPDSFEPLLRRLEEEPYNDVIEETIKSLIKVDPGKLFSLTDGFNSQVREAIGRFSDNLDVLLKLSRDEDTAVKLSAISSLGELNDKKATERIVEAIHDPDTEVRRTAVIALGAMEIGPDTLKPLLQDNDMWVRVHAVRTLGNSLRQDMVDTLAPMLKDSEIPVILAAVEAMAVIGGRDAFSTLSTIADHGDEAVQKAVREVLERF
jgi:HEAT repeat protein